MEKSKFLEAGRIVNTHGIMGEVKIQPWCDSPDFLCGFEHYYIGEAPIKVLSAYVHKNCVIAQLEGITSVSAAVSLKNAVVNIAREDVALEEGAYFVADAIGLPVFDVDSGEQIGTLKDVLEYPASKIFVVSGSEEHLIPAVPEFLKRVDIEGGAIYVHIIEGL